ncbi:MAG: hypothetical protein IPO92_14950 [Saprospiraceae bacterium]|nr:hypothetical protein [Saprospiraceae bacterium]
MSFRSVHAICLMLFFSYIGNTQELVVRVNTVQMGEDSVNIKIFEKQGEILSYIHVHENETASLEAGLDVLKKYGGKLVTLAHSFDGSTNRNISFRHKNTSYQFDPNRIYTNNDSILINSVKVVKGNGKVDDGVLKMIRNLANQIWKEISSYALIVALHNNKNTPEKYTTKWLFWKKHEPESYNVTSYVKKCDHSSDSNKSCSDIYINPSINNSEFFIVTERRDFSSFYKKRFSVVLQNEDPVDDGSMSVFALKNKKRYINAEAKHGRVAQQKAMLELIHQF